jgi:acetate---CoA ligase (ADP-forming)
MMTTLVSEFHDGLRGGIGPLLFPRSLAIVGASERNTRPIQGALRGGIPVHLINPNRSEVLGRPCHPRLTGLSEDVETALLLVSHSRVVEAAEDALAAGVRGLVVPGIGAEAGAEGPAVIERVRALANTAGAGVIGPNCMGVAQPGGPSTWIGTIPETALPGHVSVIAQSGSIGEAFLSCGPRIGFRVVVSCGGELNRDAADILGFLAEDDGTRAVGLFLEAVRRPASFAAALARCAEAEKPVVCLKVGRSEAAARTTLAHTGALVGSARAFSALLRRYGAIEVTDVHDLFETLDVLGRENRPRGLRVAAVSESGGECALLADHGEAVGMPFTPLPHGVAAQLKEEFPNFLAPENPLDAWAIAEETIVYPRSFELLAGSGAFDILAAQVDLSQFRGKDEAVWCEMIVRSLADGIEGTDVFPVVVSVHESDPPPAIAALARERDIPLLRGTQQALRALAAVARWEPVHPTENADVPVDLSDLLRPGPLSEHESATCLERYGIEFAPRRRAAGPDAAARAAAELGFPVVVKVDGPAHKAVDGGVVLGIQTPADAAAAAERLGGRVLVARQADGRLEALCGMSRDPSYGPVLAVGLGGAAVEALSLVSVCLAPINLQAARDLVAEAPGLAAATEVAQDAIARTLVALGRLAAEHPEIVACDVNPLILRDDDAVAVDALVVVSEDAGEESVQ